MGQSLPLTSRSGSGGHPFPAETDQESSENAGTPSGRDTGCDHEWHIEQSNRRSEQQNRDRQTRCVWIQAQGQFQNSDPLSPRKTESDAGKGEVTRKYLIFPTRPRLSCLTNERTTIILGGEVQVRLMCGMFYPPKSLKDPNIKAT